MSLTTNYLGLVLRNPIVASSSPLSHSVDSIRRLEDAGASAVVMYSLFEEQITFDSLYVDNYLRSGTNTFAESLSFFPEMDEYNVWPDEYLNLIRRAKEAVDISNDRRISELVVGILGFQDWPAARALGPGKQSGVGNQNRSLARPLLVHREDSGSEGCETHSLQAGNLAANRCGDGRLLHTCQLPRDLQIHLAG